MARLTAKGKTSKRLQFKNYGNLPSGTQYIYQGRKRRGAGFLAGLISSARRGARALAKSSTVKKGLAIAKKQLKKKSTQKLITRAAEGLANQFIDKVQPGSSEEKRLIKQVKKQQIKKLVRSLTNNNSPLSKRVLRDNSYELLRHGSS